VFFENVSCCSRWTWPFNRFVLHHFWEDESKTIAAIDRHDCDREHGLWPCLDDDARCCCSRSGHTRLHALRLTWIVRLSPIRVPSHQSPLFVRLLLYKLRIALTSLQQIEYNKCLSRGAFAVCRVGHKNSDPTFKVAVKTMMRDHPRFDLAAIKNEIDTMRGIKHPRCINLIEVGVNIRLHISY